MKQEELNFKIAISIQNELEDHNLKLKTLSKLLLWTDMATGESTLLNTENFGYGLSQLIDSWLEEQDDIIEHAVQLAKERPGYIQARAREILRLKNEGARLSTFGDLEEIMESLGAVMKVFGKQNYPEAEGLLNSLRAAFQEEVGQSLLSARQAESCS